MKEYALWQVYEQYCILRARNGYLYDWDDMALAVEDELKIDRSDWIYRHVVIDEGQDFSPMMIKSLAAATPANGSLTFCGDVAQQVYGVRVSWKNAGLKIKKVWNFQENYRNSQEIANLALAISQMPYFADEPDIVKPNAARAAGPLPALVKLPNLAAEKELIIQNALNLGRTQRVGILVKTREQVRQILSRLQPNSFGVLVVELHHDRGTWFWKPGIMVGTYQSAKGLEFEAVFMPYCGNQSMPDPERIDEVGIDEASAEGARLLYVGVTRAKTRLIITFSGQLTNLLPTDMSLYNYLAQ